MTLQLSILPHQRAVAPIIGRARTKGHDDRRRPEEDLGEHGNTEADEQGALAELVIIAALEIAGLTPQDYNFYSRLALPGPDFKLEHARYEIKSFKSDSGYLYANEAQRINTAHLADYLLPCTRLPNHLAVFEAISYSELANWQLRDERGAPYRSLPVSSLRPLVTLEDLPRAAAHLDPAQRNMAVERVGLQKMSFGKYKGRDIKDVPRGYLTWSLSQLQYLSPALHAAIRLFLDGP